MAQAFAPYHQWIDQGYAYRYYAPEPGPTPVVTATLHFTDGRPDATVRLPERGLKPRLRYQRQLALANHLAVDFEQARLQTGDGRRSRWAASYARHLCKTHPGCAGVTLFVQSHLIPDPERVREALATPGCAGGPGRRRVFHDAGTNWSVLVRRLLNDLAAYLADLLGTAVRAWNAFFFRPADPTTLGLIRVALGLLLTWNLWVYGFELHAYLGSEGWADPTLVRSYLSEQMPYAWSFWFLVPDGLLRPVWLGCLAVLACYTAGLWSRVTAVLAWVIVVSTVRRVPMALFGFDQVVSTWRSTWRSRGRAARRFRSTASWRGIVQARAAVARRRHDGRWVVSPGAPEPTISANLALRLIQLHLTLIYGMAGLAKLQGQAWWSGLAIWGVLASAEFRQLDLTWLVAYPWLLNMMTHTSLALELSYPILIWVRKFRPLLLVAVVLLHAGIGLTSPGLIEFGLAMLAGNLAFASGPWLRSLVAGRESPAGRVLYDGACPRCRASMALIAAGDPDRVIEPVDLTAINVATIHPSLTKEACLRAMHLVRADGRVVAGYDALRTLGLWIPLSWPLALVGSLPGITWAGRRAYHALAASRPRDVPCTDEVCGIHSRSGQGQATQASSATHPE